MGSAQAVIMTAIALAESGGNDAAIGDVGREDATWGPSSGLYQIRTLKADTGRGTDREISALTNPANQARAAYDMSRGGTDFSAWSVYTGGQYQQFLGQAQAGAAAGGGTSVQLQQWGPDWAPWNVAGAVSDAATTYALSGVRFIVIEGIAVALGLGLLAFGVARLASPTVGRIRAREKDAQRKVAKVAMMAA
jgi:hypothetical protein